MEETTANGNPDKVKVNLQIEGMSYSFFISPDEEETVREAHKILSDRLAKLHNYNFRTPQDALATVALQMTVQYLKEKKKDISGNLIRELLYLDNQLDEYIRNKVK